MCTENFWIVDRRTIIMALPIIFGEYYNCFSPVLNAALSAVTLDLKQAEGDDQEATIQNSFDQSQVMNNQYLLAERLSPIPLRPTCDH